MDTSINQTEPEIPKIPTGYTYDVQNKKMIPSFSIVNPEDINIISEKRLSICRSCELFTKQGACSFCGCGMSYKSALIYPLDDNGKAFQQVDANGNYYYVCHLKKW